MSEKKQNIKQKTNKKKKKKVTKAQAVLKMICIAAILGLAMFLFNIAPNYKLNYTKDKTNLIINNRNVTERLKNNVYINERGTIYLSLEDVQNFFDKYVIFDEKEEQVVTTSDKQVSAIKLNQKNMVVNGSNVNLLDTILEKDSVIYLPLTEMKEVYNIDLFYVEDTDTIILESKERKLTKADVSKKLSVKTLKDNFSRTVDKVTKGEKITLVSIEDGWARIRTERGRLGYVKARNIANQTIVREEFTPDESKINGKINMVWDYYSEYAKAPNREGQTIQGLNVISPSFFELLNSNCEIRDKVGSEGKEYIKWAKENGYQVWPIISNNAVHEDKDITSKIMNDYNLRQKLIENILDLIIKYDLDGINIDFENMYKEDIDMFSRFIIELAPRVKDYGKILSVDVTAPDGSDTWSLCYNRNILGHVSDYLIYMAYDQNRTKVGTVSGYDWIESNLIKFIEREEVPKEKIILALPFYTRLWEETMDEEAKVTSSVVNMKNADEVLSKNGITEKTWLDDVKQYYISYEKDGKLYSMWIEDTASLKHKISLVKKYDLAGVSFWSKDRESESVWEMIAEELKK